MLGYRHFSECILVTISAAVFCLCIGTPRAVAQIDAHWSNPSGGSWFTASNWSGLAVPNNGGGSTYNAFIDLAGNPYTVTLNSTAVVSNFTLNSTAATLSHSAGTFGVLGTASLQSGVYRLNGGGITGGTWNVAPGTFAIGTSIGSRFEGGVTWNGDLPLTAANAQLRISNGLVLNGTATLGGSDATMTFQGAQTLSGNATLVFDGATSGTKTISTPTGASLTLGAGVVTRGGRGEFTGGGNLTNLGSITADVAGQSLTVAPSLFANYGSMNVQTSATMALGSTTGSWLNGSTGLITNSGGTLLFRGAWSNAGTIALSSGTLNLGGTFTTAGLGTIQRTGGTLNLTGTLDNTGANLVLNDTTGSWNLNGGTIRGGSVGASGSARLVFQNSSANYLDGVTINGPLDLSNTNASVRLSPTTTFTGGLQFNGTNTRVGLDIGQTRDNQTVSFNSSGTSINTLSAEGDGTLTFGANHVIEGGGGRILSGSFLSGTSATIVNQGRITASVSGKAIEIAPTNFVNTGTLEALSGGILRLGYHGGNLSARSWTNPAGGVIRASDSTLDLGGNWSNAGLIQAQNSTVNLRGSFTAADLAGFSRTGGSVNLYGSLNNAGSVVTLNAATGSWNLLGATVSGGTINLTEGSTLGFSTNEAPSLESYLDDVTVHGDLLLDDGPSFGTPALRIGATSNVYGDITVRRGRLELDSGRVWNNSDIHMNSPESSDLRVNGTGTLTLGPNSLIRGYRTTFWGEDAAIANYGTIRAEPTFSFDIVGSLTNYGRLEAEGGAVLNVGESHPSFGADWTNEPTGVITSDGGTISLYDTWTNFGTIAVSHGTLDFNDNWSNQGIVNVSGTTWRLGGEFTPADLGSYTLSNSQVEIDGVMDNTGNTFVFNSQTGPWQLRNGTIRGGTLRFEDGVRLLYASGTYDQALDGVTIDGDFHVAGGHVHIRNGLTVTGTMYLPEDAGHTITLDGPQVLDNLTVELGTLPNTTAGNHDFHVTGGLTLESNVVMRGGHCEISGTGPIVNRGLLRSEVPTQKFELYSTQGFTNEGTLEAVNGAGLDIGYSVDTWTNTGTIRVIDSFLNLDGTVTTAGLGNLELSNSQVRFDGVLLNSGDTLTLSSATGSWRFGGKIQGGVIETLDGTRLTVSQPENSSGFTGVTLRGTVAIPGDPVEVRNGLTLDGGSVLFERGQFGFDAELRFMDTQPLLGTGELEFAGTSDRQYLRLASGVSGSLTIGPGIDIHGRAGTVGRSTQGLVSQGRIAAEAAGATITVTGNSITNSGTFSAQGGGRLLIANPAALTNLNGGTLVGGVWSVFAGSTLELPSSSIVTNVADVRLSGPGSVFAAINSIATNTGRFAIAEDRDFSTEGAFYNRGELLLGVGSTLGVTGLFTQHELGSLMIELGGTDLQTGFGSLLSIGPASLAGELLVSLAGGFMPEFGDQFQIVFAPSISGVFDPAHFPTLPDGNYFELSYAATSVTLSVVPEPTSLAAFAAFIAIYLRLHRRSG